MHHASWTTSIESKIRQLARVRRMVGGGPIRLHVESFAEMLGRPEPGRGAVRGAAESALRLLRNVPLAPGALP